MPCETEQVCKPNFVSALKADGNHSSRLFVTEQLKRPTRKRRPKRFGQMSGQLKNVSLFGLAPRGVYPAAPVTSRADALLPRRFTHHPIGLVCSLLHLSSSDYKIERPDVIRLAALRCSDFPLKFFNQSDYPTCFVCKAQLF